MGIIDHCVAVKALRLNRADWEKAPCAGGQVWLTAIHHIRTTEQVGTLTEGCHDEIPVPLRHGLRELPAKHAGTGAGAGPARP